MLFTVKTLMAFLLKKHWQKYAFYRKNAYGVFTKKALAKICFLLNVFDKTFF
jgi:hypothetical protein